MPDTSHNTRIFVVVLVTRYGTVRVVLELASTGKQGRVVCCTLCVFLDSLKCVKQAGAKARES